MIASSMFSPADNSSTCEEGAWAMRERTRIAAKLKKFKGPGEVTETPKKMALSTIRDI